MMERPDPLQLSFDFDVLQEERTTHPMQRPTPGVVCLESFRKERVGARPTGETNEFYRRILDSIRHFA